MRKYMESAPKVESEIQKPVVSEQTTSCQSTGSPPPALSVQPETPEKTPLLAAVPAPTGSHRFGDCGVGVVGVVGWGEETPASLPLQKEGRTFPLALSFSTLSGPDSCDGHS